MTETSASSVEQNFATMSQDQRDLVRLLLERKSRERREITPYPRADHTGKVRLLTSWAQQRLWFIDQLEGVRGAYSIAVAMRLRGVLDTEALQKGLDGLVQRHESLRTVFVTVDGDPRQEISAQGRFALNVIDFSRYDEAEREKKVELQKIEEAHGKFDLLIGPLIRGRLLQLAPQEHVLLVTAHHIIFDGWSMGVFLRELAELYTAHRDNRAESLRSLPIQYADYAQWQRQSLQGKDLDRQLSYWRACLDGAAPQLELPTDRQRPSVLSYRGQNVEMDFDRQLSAELRALAQRHEMTLFMILYAGWAILLYRLSGQNDLSIGTPIANRQRPELEGLIGLFVNTLVLRVQVRGEASVDEFLQQVKKVTLGAYEHQDVPFEQVVEALQPQRSLNRNPLFQVMFALQNAPTTQFQLPGLTAIMDRGVDEASVLDLFLSLEERGEEIVGSLHYATDLFDRETIERWIDCFTVLLGRMTDVARTRIDDLPIMPANELHQVIESFNATRVAYPHEKLIHELFEEQVLRTPDAIAVVFGEQCLTYAELNRRANQLARHLRQCGIGPDQLVAICLERSVEMVVALLGTMKSGGAYVPMDPDYPTERLQYMLIDASPRLLLTQERLKPKLPPKAIKAIAIDADWTDISQWADGDLDPRSLKLTVRHLAYVIYTSGSTGKPKGVMVEHAAVVNFLASMLQDPGIRAADCLFAVTTVSFDIAALEIYLPLVNGAKLVLASREVGCDGLRLMRMLENFNVTVMQATPATWQLLLSSGWEGRSNMKVLCGGEALNADLSWKMLSRVGALWNLYGPTETTIWSCRRKIEISNEHGFVESIGRPIANTQVYVLDHHLKPVPIGVRGEIFIGGVGVARGYLNRPEFTAERFIADPFSTDPKARMYKTGDLGRWWVDGTIGYLGRNDHQVKIRGFRIELGEIEAALAGHDHVRQAVVIAREDALGEKRLVAYVTHRNQNTANAEDLRARLKAVLPEYMVPSAIVVLEGFPLTPNGKLDRRALPAPEFGAPIKRHYEAPEGEVEEALAGIWQDLLRVGRIGRKDNFFDLGGHSLLSTRVISRIRELLRVDLPLRALFDAPTVEQLSVRVTAELHGRTTQESLRLSRPVRDLREEIERMHDDAVSIRIAELEKELGYLEVQQLAQDGTK